MITNLEGQIQEAEMKILEGQENAKEDPEMIRKLEEEANASWSKVVISTLVEVTVGKSKTVFLYFQPT